MKVVRDGNSGHYAAFSLIVQKHFPIVFVVKALEKVHDISEDYEVELKTLQYIARVAKR